MFRICFRFFFVFRIFHNSLYSRKYNCSEKKNMANFRGLSVYIAELRTRTNDCIRVREFTSTSIYGVDWKTSMEEWEDRDAWVGVALNVRATWQNPFQRIRLRSGFFFASFPHLHASIRGYTSMENMHGWNPGYFVKKKKILLNFDGSTNVEFGVWRTAPL